MVALDGCSDRLYWGIANLAGAVACLPICWGLPSQDWGALKIGASLGGIFLGVNSTRLISNHDRNAPIRSAWLESARMVNGAWIEQLAIANLPTTIQQPVPAGSDYYPPQLPAHNYQLTTNDSRSEPTGDDLPERGGDRKNYGKMPGLSWYPSVLGYGIPGAGKTTFFEEEIQKRLATGHEVIVLDPHASFGQWPNCEVVGAGMDYAAINAKMIWFENEIKRRYRIRQTQPNPKFQPLTILAEEFTNWATRCKNSGEHFKTVNSDIRKVECYSIIVTHTRTLAGLGDAKGMASLRDESMLEVEILGDYNPVTERATPRFEALVKMPGQALSDRTLVQIERKSQQTSSVPQLDAGTPQNAPEAVRAKPGTPQGTRAEQFSALLAEILAETSPAVFSPDFPLEHDDRVKLAKIVIAQNLGQEKTILLLWGVRRGGRNHHLYVEAKTMLDRLIKEIEGTDGN